MTTLAHSANNDHRRDDLVKEVRGFGRDAAHGKDSLPKLAHKLVRAAADGIITTDKDSEGRDDAHKLYEDYAKEQSSKAIHEHTDGGIKANVSKVRKLIEMGSLPIIDPVDVMNRASIVREAIRKADPKLLKPTYAGLVDVARAQLESPGTALTDEELKGIVSKGEREDKTVVDELKSIHKKLENLITGEKGLKDQSPEIVAAHEQITARLAALLQDQADAKFAAECAARGVLIPAAA
jgi:hypothetical protein